MDDGEQTTWILVELSFLVKSWKFKSPIAQIPLEIMSRQNGRFWAYVLPVWAQMLKRPYDNAQGDEKTFQISKSAQ